MSLNGFPIGGTKWAQKCHDRRIKTHTKNELCVCVCMCLCFSVYTDIKGSLRRWNCVCIEAFGSFSQRLLCCHGNACWTRVLWIFQKPPFSSDHLGSFHNTHYIQNFPLRGGRPVGSKLVKVSSQFVSIVSAKRVSDGMRLTTETNRWATHADIYGLVCINAKRPNKHHSWWGQ